MGGNQPSRPEPHAERQVGAVHDRAGGDRRLLAAAFAAEGQRRAARQTPRLPPAATRAGEAPRPARARQMLAARGVVGKASLEFTKRAGIIGHERALYGVCSWSVLSCTLAGRHKSLRLDGRAGLNRISNIYEPLKHDVLPTMPKIENRYYRAGQAIGAIFLSF